MSNEIVFPQRPGAGVQTPHLPAADDSSIQPQSLRDQEGVEVAVLRPTIRPPTYNEVVMGLAIQEAESQGRVLPSPGVHTPGGLSHIGAMNTPSGGGTTLKKQQQQHGHGGVNASRAAAAAAGGSGELPPTSSSNSSSYSTGLPCSCPPGMEKPVDISIDSHHHQSQHQDVSPPRGGTAGIVASPSPSKKRQLACWNVGSKARGEDVIPTLKYRTIGDTVKGCLMSEHHRNLTNQELKVDWKRICALQQGKEIFRLRPPYVDRDEFADPLRDIVTADKKTGKPAVTIPCGYCTIKRKDGLYDHVPWGVRPTTKEATQVALKPTEIDPMEEKIQLAGSPLRSSAGSNNNTNKSAAAASGGPIADRMIKARDVTGKVTGGGGPSNSEIQPHEMSRQLREQAAVPLNRPPSNPLIEEADKRLQQQQLGGLATVSRASDEAVSHLLKFVGFSDAERLAILWEIRKAQRNSTSTRKFF